MASKPALAPVRPTAGRRRIYYGLNYVAAATGMSYKQTSRWLQQSGALVKIGTRYYTSKARLVEAGLAEIANLL